MKNQKINKLIKDNFVTTLMGFNSYITNKKITSQQLKNIKKPFFLTMKLKEKFFFKTNFYNIKIKLISKLIFFERKFQKKQNLNINCRIAKKNDLKQIENIAKEKNLLSRFILDKLIPERFKNTYRLEWIKNFFRKLRGDYLVVATSKKKILGFILILKRNNKFIIDLIATKKQYRKKRVASSLINYVNNNILSEKQKLIAGTQKKNLIAIKMYKKLGFVEKKKEIYCYHVHGR